MLKLRSLAVVAALSTLACTGVLGEPADTGATSTDTGGSSGPEDGVRQTTSCKDYLACLEEADADEYDDVKGKYGEDGSCWQSTKDKMQECDAECEEAYEELIDEEGSGVCESEDDTGDTGGGGGCPLEAGSYGSEWSVYEDTCSIEDYLPTGIEVSCSNDVMSITIELLGTTLPCETAGREFACEISGDYYVGISGTASSNKSTAETRLLLDAGCYTEADVYLYQDEW